MTSKFSPSGGPITIEARQNGAEAIVSVRDSGIGIPPAEHEQIFDRYYQAERHRPTSGAGAGIGLSLVRSYVHLLGGWVWVESARGVGSTFYFTLPTE